MMKYLILLLVSINCYASPMQEFVDGYNSGKITNFADNCTDNKDNCSAVYREFLARKPDSRLLLKDVYWSDSRFVATFEANGKTGTMEAWVEDGKITRIEHENVIHIKQRDNHIADAGQALDGISTAVSISNGATELNGLRPDSAGGNIIFSAGIIGIRHFVKATASTEQCAFISKPISAAGWAGGIANTGQLIGMSFGAAFPIGIIVGIVAYQQDYRSECLPDNYIEEIS